MVVVSKQVVFFVFLVLFLLCVACTHSVGTENKIYIRGDGTIEGTTKIHREVDTYTFVGDINGAVIVEKDDITIEGAGYRLFGDGYSIPGFSVHHRKNVTLRNIEVWGFSFGINLYGSSRCHISQNRVFNSSFVGIKLEEEAKYNTITGNIVADCGSIGISIMYDSSNNVLRDNEMNNNQFNFNIKGAHLFQSEVSSFVNDIDTSNTVDGKSLIYWVGEADRIVPLEAGCVILVDCQRILVENLHLSKNTPAILLAYTTDSTIANNDIKDSGRGIDLHFSSDNQLQGNTLANNRWGIALSQGATSNSAFQNNISYCEYGLSLSYYSNNNRIFENIIKNNTQGLDLYQAQFNTFSQNIIADNSKVGIEFFGSKTTNNTFLDNTINHNNVGLDISGASNSICGNIFSENNIGLKLRGQNNILKNNSFYGNNGSFDALTAPVGNFNHHVNDVDSSNTVEDKPIIYWIGETDQIVPYEAGYVALINCSRIRVEKLTLSQNAHGILLVSTTNSVITENNLLDNLNGIYLSESSNNTILENQFHKNDNGIVLQENSFENTVSLNTLNGANGNGIFIKGSSSNNLIHNDLENNVVGIVLHSSMDNLLRENRMQYNQWNFKVEGRPYPNDIDSSNLVDGKPIIYWVNKSNQVVPLDAGYVVLIECELITVQNLSLAGNQQGILLAYTTDSKILDCYLTENTIGIHLYHASRINATKNYVGSNRLGIELWGNSENCIFVENWIANNGIGVYLSGLGNSSFCRNSIADNNEQVSYYTGAGGFKTYQWDDGLEGNYWSDYMGDDANGDGLGDTPYFMNEKNQDNHPLIQPTRDPPSPLPSPRPLPSPEPTISPSPTPTLQPPPTPSPEPSPSPTIEPTPTPEPDEPGFKFPTAEVVISIVVISIALVSVYYLKRKPENRKE